MDLFEYMLKPIKLNHTIKDGYFYMEIRKGMYGLSQVGFLANQLRKKQLANYGYYKVPQTPDLWKHHT